MFRLILRDLDSFAETKSKINEIHWIPVISIVDEIFMRPYFKTIMSANLGQLHHHYVCAFRSRFVVDVVRDTSKYKDAAVTLRGNVINLDVDY